MNRDPVREHLDTRTEAEITWMIRFLPGTRARLEARPVTKAWPELTPEQLDAACVRAERELATYELALMIVEAMPPGERADREERASRCVTSWTALRKPPAYSGCTVRAKEMSR